MNYTNHDARFDAEQLGRCPICGRTRYEGCTHCEVCGRSGGKHWDWCDDDDMDRAHEYVELWGVIAGPVANSDEV